MSATQVARRVLRRLRRGGWRELWQAAGDRLAPARPAMRPAVRAATLNQVGLEVGGPSRLFGRRGILPLYPGAARIDNVNFATETAWEHGLQDGGEFRFDPGRPPGRQWMREAVALTGLADGAYDFVASSHCLEHVADPLGALDEWRRVTRRGGHLVLVLPDPARTFDHRRPLTTLDHLRDDRLRRTGEDDLTHAPEALACHDLARDPGVASEAEFRLRTADNPRNRCLHHHVFDLALIAAALADSGWRVLATEQARPLHLLALAVKETA